MSANYQCPHCGARLRIKPAAASLLLFPLVFLAYRTTGLLSVVTIGAFLLACAAALIADLTFFSVSLAEPTKDAPATDSRT